LRKVFAETAYLKLKESPDASRLQAFSVSPPAFSKKLENLQAAVELHFAHYNLVRLHKT
jgi:hypothetical protein